MPVTPRGARVGETTTSARNLMVRADEPMGGSAEGLQRPADRDESADPDDLPPL
jgi:hypothetical protein